MWLRRSVASTETPTTSGVPSLGSSKYAPDTGGGDPPSPGQSVQSCVRALSRTAAQTSLSSKDITLQREEDVPPSRSIGELRTEETQLAGDESGHIVVQDGVNQTNQPADQLEVNIERS